METNNNKHVLAIPYPSQGHINPMLQFCKRLNSYGGIATTFATTLFISNTFAPSLPNLTTSPSLQFATFSDGFDLSGFAAAPSIAHYLHTLSIAGSRTLDNLLRTTKFHCLIYDPFLPWALDVAKRYHIPAAAFFTQACTVNYVYYLIHNTHLPLPISSFPVPVQGLQVLRSLADMPSFVSVDGSYPDYFQMVLNQFSNADRADFVLVNSVYEFEPQAVDSMSNLCPLLTIGPTVPSSYSDNRIPDDTHYGFNLFESRDEQRVREWLDSKPDRSVVYVSFGSMANLSEAQMEELAQGLEATELHFLWVVRESEKGKLKSVRSSKGMIVMWSSQIEVLSHSAVGCFFTHCGWNSTIEALTLGVPMVGMPQWTDQPTAAVLVQELWRVGVRVRVDQQTELVGRDEIASCIRRVMESDEMRENAAKWRRVAVDAVRDGGSSDTNIRYFISKLNHFCDDASAK